MKTPIKNPVTFTITLSLILFLLCGGTSWANSLRHLDSGLEIGEVSYGGTGCPGGTLDTRVSEGQNTFSVYFSQFFAHAGEPSGRRTDRKVCNLAIPLHVPQGRSVAILPVSFEGYAAIPVGGEGRMSIEYFQAGTRGPKISKVFPGGFEQDFSIRDGRSTFLQWSECGQDTNLRVSTSLLVKSNENYDTSLLAIDNPRSRGYTFRILSRNCR